LKIIFNGLKKNQKLKKKDIKIYSLNGDWSDGTFLIVDRRNVLFSTVNETWHPLLHLPDGKIIYPIDDVKPDRLLTALHLLDKSKSFLFFGFPSCLLSTIEYFNGKPWESIATATILYKIKKEVAKNFEINPPTGIVLKQLTKDNVKTINEIWPHRYPGSERFLGRLIHYNMSLGAFKEDTGEIMAWCLILPIRALGALHVKKEYKRQGLGSLLVRAMSKKFADQNEDTIAPVVVQNIPSRNMFEKIGFKEIDNIYWVESIAKDPNFIWPEDEI